MPASMARLGAELMQCSAAAAPPWRGSTCQFDPGTACVCLHSTHSAGLTAEDRTQQASSQPCKSDSPAAPQPAGSKPAAPCGRAPCCSVLSAGVGTTVTAAKECRASMASAKHSIPCFAPACNLPGAALKRAVGMLPLAPSSVLRMAGLDVAARFSSAAAACLLVEMMPLGCASSPT